MVEEVRFDACAASTWRGGADCMKARSVAAHSTPSAEGTRSRTSDRCICNSPELYRGLRDMRPDEFDDRPMSRLVRGITAVTASTCAGRLVDQSLLRALDLGRKHAGDLRWHLESEIREAI